MALFGSKKKKEAAAPDAPTKSDTNHVTVRDLSHVLRHARITEKATMHAQDGVYVFDVAETASKRDIMAAVKKLYSVTAAKVRVATVRAKIKRSARTGKTGMTTGGKKAYVYLKKGDTINL